jgi:hypothetical protein
MGHGTLRSAVGRARTWLTAPPPPTHTHTRHAPVRPYSRCSSRRCTHALTFLLAGCPSVTPTANTWRICQRMMRRAPAAAGDTAPAVGPRCAAAHMPRPAQRTTRMPRYGRPGNPGMRPAPHHRLHTSPPGCGGSSSRWSSPSTSSAHCATGMSGWSAFMRCSRSNSSLLQVGGCVLVWGVDGGSGRFVGGALQVETPQPSCNNGGHAGGCCWAPTHRGW